MNEQSPSPQITQSPAFSYNPGLNVLEKSLLFVYFFSFVFDFRSENAGGEWIHYVFLTLSEVSFVLFVALIIGRRKVENMYLVRAFPIVLALFITLYSPIISIYRGISPSDMLPLELRYVLLTQSIIMVYLVARIGADFKYIVIMIFLSTIAGLIWNLYYTFIISEYELSYVRYRIAPLHIISIVAAGFSVFFGANLFYLIPFSFAVVLIQLSSTRGLLGMMIIAYVFLHLYALIMTNRKTIIAFICIDLAAIPVIGMLFLRGTFDNWLLRFTLGETGVGQATWLSRLAEYVSQWNILTSSWDNLILGAGLGATFFRDLSTLRYAIYSGHFGVEDYAGQTLGHSLYFYSLFSGGVLAGWIVPFLIIISIVYSIRNIFYSSGAMDRKRLVLDIQCHSYLLMVAVIGFLAHPFNSRLLCLHLGAIIAITFIYPRSRDGALKR